MRANSPRLRPIRGGLPARRVAEAIFPEADVRYVDRFEAIADLFDRLRMFS